MARRSRGKVVVIIGRDITTSKPLLASVVRDVVEIGKPVVAKNDKYGCRSVGVAVPQPNREEKVYVWHCGVTPVVCDVQYNPYTGTIVAKCRKAETEREVLLPVAEQLLVEAQKNLEKLSEKTLKKLVTLTLNIVMT